MNDYGTQDVKWCRDQDSNKEILPLTITKPCKTTRRNSASATSVTSNNNREPGTTTSDRTYSATSDQNGIRPDPLKVEAIRQCPRPKCVRDVRSILGAAGFYRRFCPSYSEVIKARLRLGKQNKSEDDRYLTVDDILYYISNVD
ncbi:hypothetical protein DPMN_047778 [Dreissena polymorpha]|uniref:Uncharacterized protein n=1 Tax=Dreissena polymorpha TaxID=45954 RepID=A0A9D4D9G9_DREPO|nr:hypothetical protein DPMN_047778 [Dreissena polymorpha]